MGTIYNNSQPTDAQLFDTWFDTSVSPPIAKICTSISPITFTMNTNFQGNKIINVANPVNPQDAMTMNSAQTTAAGIPRVWVNGVHKTSVWEYFSSATVSSGNVVFNLTDDGTGSGNAVFSNIYLESLNLIIYSSSAQYQFSAPTISANKKTLTVTVGVLGTVILGIIQFVTAANGITVYAQVKGD